MINLDLSTKLVWNQDLIKAPNLTDRFSKDNLDRIGNWCKDGFDRDIQSRAPWERRMQAAMNLAMQLQEAKTFPWPGASNVVFPLTTIAALGFSATAYTNLIQGDDIIKYRVVGPDQDGKLTARAQRIGAHMSWQMLEEDEAWESEHDRLLIYLSIIGCAFTKSFMSGKRGCVVSDFVTAQDLVVNYWAKTLATAARKTQIIQLSRNDIYTGIMKDIYRDVRDEAWYQGAPPTQVMSPYEQGRDKRIGMYPQSADDASPFIGLEQHVQMDLDGDGYDEPYIVTLENESRKVIRLVARVEDESAVERTSGGEIVSITPTEYFTKWSFIPSPDNGFYEVGFGTLLGPMNETVNSGVNQLLDAGTVQNSNGGFLGRGAKMRGGTYTIAPFEWKRIDSTGDDLRKNMVQFPKSEPSQVTLALINLMIEYAKIVAGTQDAVTGENPGQNTPASTYQSMSEKGMRLHTMIMKRVWRSLKEEAKVRYMLNRAYCRTESNFGANNSLIRREDYLGNPDQVAPVADPNMPSATLRLAQASAIVQRSMQTSGYDLEVVEREFLKALRVQNIDQVYPGLKSGKVQPLPNAKVMDIQVKASKLKLDQQRFAGELQNQKKKTDAEAVKLKAEAAKLIKDAGNVGAAEKLQAFKMAIELLEQHSSHITQRIQAMSKQQGEEGEENGEGEGEPSLGGGVPGLASASGNGGAEGGSGEVAAGGAGGLGGKGVSG